MTFFYSFLLQAQALYYATFAQVLLHNVGGVFGLHVAIYGAFRVHHKGGAGAFFAVLAEVEAVAGLYPHFVPGTARKQAFQALFLQLNFQGFGYVLAHFILLSSTNEQANNGRSGFHRAQKTS